jgi:hypothetical protein
MGRSGRLTATVEILFRMARFGRLTATAEIFRMVRSGRPTATVGTCVWCNFTLQSQGCSGLQVWSEAGV